MELPSLNELRKRRKKLVRDLHADAGAFEDSEVGRIEAELNALCKETIRKEIGDIDAQIAERTGCELTPDADNP